MKSKLAELGATIDELPSTADVRQVFLVYIMFCMLSVLWHCWLAVRKSIRPIKSEWRGAGVVICLERGANDLPMVQLMPLPLPSFLASLKPRLV